MFIPSHKTSASHPLREHRTLRFVSPDHASESLHASEAIRQNADVRRYRNLFVNRHMRDLYPELRGRQPLNRFFLQALVLGQSIDPSFPLSYQGLDRSSLDIDGALNLLGRSNEQIGQWLKDNMPEDLLRQIDPDLDTDSAAGRTRLGERFRDRLLRARRDWRERKTIGDQLVVRAVVERYRTVKRDLDGVLGRAGIQIPDVQGNVQALGARGLTRQEYFILLTLVWRERISVTGKSGKALEERFRKGGLPEVRRLLRNWQTKTEITRQMQVYSDLSFEELGPQESLSTLGITLGPDLQRAYLRMVQGQTPDLGEFIDVGQGPAGGSGAIIRRPTDPITELPLQDRAGTWERAVHDQQKARLVFTFLSQSMEATQGNAHFLSNFEYWFVLGDKERKERGRPANPLDRDDTAAILKFISQSLVECERVLEKTREQQRKLRENLTTAQSVERTVGDAWNYILEVRKHPVGSILMGLTAFLIIRQMYRFLFKDKASNFTKLLVYGAIIGGAIGLYQQHRHGRAWWESAWNGIRRFNKRERQRPPEEQSLPNYWYDQLGLDSGAREFNETQKITALSVLNNQKLGDVLIWYQAMSKAKLQDRLRGYERHTFRIDSRTRRNFGRLKPAQESELFYQVLTEFFKNRGAFARQQFPEIYHATALGDDAALGFDYIAERYNQERIFKSMSAGEIRIGGITYSGRQIMNDNDPAVQRLRKERPKLYADLVRIRRGFFAETRRRRSSDWNMSMVFLLEANPEILRRMGEDARQVSTVVQQIGDVAGKVAEHVTTPFRPPERDRAHKIDIFHEEESGDLEPFGGSALHFAEEMSDRETVLDSIRKDFDAFVARLPIQNAARPALRKYIREYIEERLKAGDPVADIAGKIETKKYQLLIGCLGAPQRISEKNVKDLLAGEEAGWTRWLHDLIGDDASDWILFDRAYFPDMRNLSDVNSLFNSEASQFGGVAMLNIGRLFPRWRQHDFGIITKRITAHHNRFERLRRSPIGFRVEERAGVSPLGAAFTVGAPLAAALAGAPGMKKIVAEGLSPARITSLERLIAQRLANRVIEAMLVTHSKQLDDRYVPDAAADRDVTKIEMQNLATYLDELVEHYIDIREIDRRLDAFEKRKEELRKITWTYTGIGGAPSLYSGRMEIRNTGTAGEFTVGMNYGTAASSRMLYPLTMRTEEILKSSAHQIYERWRQRAFDAKKIEMENVAAVAEADLPSFEIRLSGDDIEYSQNFAVAHMNARTPLRLFIPTDRAVIYQKYKDWMANLQPGRAPTQRDPFTSSNPY